MFQLLFLLLLFCSISIFIKHNIARLIYAIFATIFFVSQSISYFTQNVPINEAFFNHLNIESVAVAFKSYTLYAIFGCLLLILLPLAIYYIRQLIHSKLTKKLYLIPIIIIVLSFLAMSFKSGIVYESVAFVKRVQSSQYSKDLTIEEVFKKYGFDYKKFVKREDIRATPGKNVVIILLESFETALFDNNIFDNLTPNMQRLQKEMAYFKLNGSQNRHWSFSAMYLLMTGFPYSFFDYNELFAFTDNITRMPGIGDVFSAADYNMLTVSGSISFAGTDIFQKMYNFKVLGIKDDLPDDAKFHVWGAFDHDIFELAKREYIKLSKSDKPFVLQIFTLDTHAPFGHYDNRFPKKGEDDIEAAIYITDYLLNDFLEFLKAQDNYDNTAVFILPDHKSRGSTESKIKHTDRSLFLYTNVPEDKLSAKTGQTLFFTDVPRLIIEGAGVKSNAFLLGDLFKRKDNNSLFELELSDINFVNKYFWNVFAFDSDVVVEKEILTDKVRFKLVNKNGNVFYSDMIGRNSKISFDFSRGILKKLPLNYKPASIHISLIDTNKGFLAYIGDNQASGIYLMSEGNKLELKLNDYKRVVDSIKTGAKASKGEVINIISHGLSSIGKVNIPLARGITILFKEGSEGKTAYKSFDTYAYADQTIDFIDKLKETFDNNTFVAMYVFDEGSYSLGSYIDYIKNLGLPALANLGYREPYIAVKNINGYLYELSSKTEPNIAINFIESSGDNANISFPTHIPPRRGITLITKNGDDIAYKSYDTYGYAQQADEFINDVTTNIINGSFLAMYVFDEASNMLANYKDNLINLGLTKLANLGFREKYVAYNSLDGIVEILGTAAKPDVLVDLLLFDNSIVPSTPANAYFADAILKITTMEHGTL